MPLSRACLRTAGSLIVVSLVTGCAATRPAVTSPRDLQRAQLLTLQSWEARGRIAIQNGEEGGQANLRWQQAGDRSQIQLAGPFGAGAYDIVWEPELVSVADADGEQTFEYRGVAAAEQFLQTQLGWSFPAGSTRYWLMGLLDPAAAGDEQRADDGTLLAIRQHGWDVRFKSFMQVQGYDLPARLELQNANASLRVVITRWTLQPTGSH